MLQWTLGCMCLWGLSPHEGPPVALLDHVAALYSVVSGTSMLSFILAVTTLYSPEQCRGVRFSPSPLWHWLFLDLWMVFALHLDWTTQKWMEDQGLLIFCTERQRKASRKWGPHFTWLLYIVFPLKWAPRAIRSPIAIIISLCSYSLTQ